MSTISAPGIGSGLDVNSIINQLIAVERIPIDDLQAKNTKIQAQISEYGKLKSAMSALRDASLALTKSDTWGASIGTSSNASAVGVAVKSGAALGNLAVTVQRLASAQSLAGGVMASPTALVGAGTLHIELGAWNADQSAFTPKSGATAVDITVEATDTLAQVRDKINASGAGVTAMILTDAGGSRLIMRSSESGAANAFRTSVVDADGANADASGLSALAYDPSAGAAVMSRTEAAGDAEATLNGLPVRSASNTLVDIVDGVTLTLQQVAADPVTIGVVSDKEALKKSVQAFADAYNALSKLLGQELKYDAASDTAGPLQGDSTAVGLQRQLRALVGNASGASTAFTRLSDVGLEMQRDGTLTVNATKLDAAVTNLPEVEKFFANTDLTTPANDGIARQFRLMTDAMLSVDGSIATRTNGLQANVDNNNDQQDRLEIRVAQTEKRLRAQYTALDATMGKMQGLSSYLNQQLQKL